MKIEVILLSFLLYWDAAYAEPRRQKLNDQIVGKVYRDSDDFKVIGEHAAERWRMNDGGVNSRGRRANENDSSWSSWRGLFLDAEKRQEPFPPEASNISIRKDSAKASSSNQRTTPLNSGNRVRNRRSIWKPFVSDMSNLNRDAFKSDQATSTETRNEGSTLHKITEKSNAESNSHRSSLYKRKFSDGIFDDFDDWFMLGRTFNAGDFTRSFYEPSYSGRYVDEGRNEHEEPSNGRTASKSHEISPRNEERFKERSNEDRYRDEHREDSHGDHKSDVSSSSSGKTHESGKISDGKISMKGAQHEENKKDEFDDKRRKTFSMDPSKIDGEKFPWWKSGLYGGYLDESMEDHGYPSKHGRMNAGRSFRGEYREPRMGKGFDRVYETYSPRYLEKFRSEKLVSREKDRYLVKEHTIDDEYKSNQNGRHRGTKMKSGVKDKKFLADSPHKSFDLQHFEGRRNEKLEQADDSWGFLMKPGEIDGNSYRNGFYSGEYDFDTNGDEHWRKFGKKFDDSHKEPHLMHDKKVPNNKIAKEYDFDANRDQHWKKFGKEFDDSHKGTLSIHDKKVSNNKITKEYDFDANRDEHWKKSDDSHKEPHLMHDKKVPNNKIAKEYDFDANRDQHWKKFGKEFDDSHKGTLSIHDKKVSNNKITKEYDFDANRGEHWKKFDDSHKQPHSMHEEKVPNNKIAKEYDFDANRDKHWKKFGKKFDDSHKEPHSIHDKKVPNNKIAKEYDFDTNRDEHWKKSDDSHKEPHLMHDKKVLNNKIAKEENFDTNRDEHWKKSDDSHKEPHLMHDKKVPNSKIAYEYDFDTNRDQHWKKFDDRHKQPHSMHEEKVPNNKIAKEYDFDANRGENWKKIDDSHNEPYLMQVKKVLSNKIAKENDFDTSRDNHWRKFGIKFDDSHKEPHLMNDEKVPNNKVSKEYDFDSNKDEYWTEFGKRYEDTDKEPHSMHNKKVPNNNVAEEYDIRKSVHSKLHLKDYESEKRSGPIERLNYKRIPTEFSSDHEKAENKKSYERYSPHNERTPIEFSKRRERILNKGNIEEKRHFYIPDPKEHLIPTTRNKHVEDHQKPPQNERTSHYNKKTPTEFSETHEKIPNKGNTDEKKQFHIPDPKEHLIATTRNKHVENQQKRPENKRHFVDVIDIDERDDHDYSSHHGTPNRKTNSRESANEGEHRRKDESRVKSMEIGESAGRNSRVDGEEENASDKHRSVTAEISAGARIMANKRADPAKHRGSNEGESTLKEDGIAGRGRKIANHSARMHERAREDVRDSSREIEPSKERLDGKVNVNRGGADSAENRGEKWKFLDRGLKINRRNKSARYGLDERTKSGSFDVENYERAESENFSGEIDRRGSVEEEEEEEEGEDRLKWLPLERAHVANHAKDDSLKRVLIKDRENIRTPLQKFKQFDNDVRFDGASTKIKESTEWHGRGSDNDDGFQKEGHEFDGGVLDESHMNFKEDNKWVNYNKSGKKEYIYDGVNYGGEEYKNVFHEEEKQGRGKVNMEVNYRDVPITAQQSEEKNSMKLHDLDEERSKNKQKLHKEDPRELFSKSDNSIDNKSVERKYFPKSGEVREKHVDKYEGRNDFINSFNGKETSKMTGNRGITDDDDTRSRMILEEDKIWKHYADVNVDGKTSSIMKEKKNIENKDTLVTKMEVLKKNWVQKEEADNNRVHYEASPSRYLQDFNKDVKQTPKNPFHNYKTKTNKTKEMLSLPEEVSLKGEHNSKHETKFNEINDADLKKGEDMHKKRNGKFNKEEYFEKEEHRSLEEKKRVELKEREKFKTYDEREDRIFLKNSKSHAEYAEGDEFSAYLKDKGIKVSPFSSKAKARISTADGKTSDDKTANVDDKRYAQKTEENETTRKLKDYSLRQKNEENYKKESPYHKFNQADYFERKYGRRNSKVEHNKSKETKKHAATINYLNDNDKSETLASLNFKTVAKASQENGDISSEDRRTHEEDPKENKFDARAERKEKVKIAKSGSNENHNSKVRAFINSETLARTFEKHDERFAESDEAYVENGEGKEFGAYSKERKEIQTVTPGWNENDGSKFVASKNTPTVVSVVPRNEETSSRDEVYVAGREETEYNSYLKGKEFQRLKETDRTTKNHDSTIRSGKNIAQEGGETIKNNIRTNEIFGKLNHRIYQQRGDVENMRPGSKFIQEERFGREYGGINEDKKGNIAFKENKKLETVMYDLSEAPASANVVKVASASQKDDEILLDRGAVYVPDAEGNESAFYSKNKEIHAQTGSSEGKTWTSGDGDDAGHKKSTVASGEELERRKMLQSINAESLHRNEAGNTNSKREENNEEGEMMKKSSSSKVSEETDGLNDWTLRRNNENLHGKLSTASGSNEEHFRKKFGLVSGNNEAYNIGFQRREGEKGATSHSNGYYTSESTINDDTRTIAENIEEDTRDSAKNRYIYAKDANENEFRMYPDEKKKTRGIITYSNSDHAFKEPVSNPKTVSNNFHPNIFSQSDEVHNDDTTRHKSSTISKEKNRTTLTPISNKTYDPEVLTSKITQRPPQKDNKIPAYNNAHTSNSNLHEPNAYFEPEQLKYLPPSTDKNYQSTDDKSASHFESAATEESAKTNLHESNAYFEPKQLNYLPPSTDKNYQATDDKSASHVKSTAIEEPAKTNLHEQNAYFEPKQLNYLSPSTGKNYQTNDDKSAAIEEPAKTNLHEPNAYFEPKQLNNLPPSTDKNYQAIDDKSAAIEEPAKTNPHEPHIYFEPKQLNNLPPSTGKNYQANDDKSASHVESTATEEPAKTNPHEPHIYFEPKQLNDLPPSTGTNYQAIDDKSAIHVESTAIEEAAKTHEHLIAEHGSNVDHVSQVAATANTDAAANVSDSNGNDGSPSAAVEAHATKVKENGIRGWRLNQGDVSEEQPAAGARGIISPDESVRRLESSDANDRADVKGREDDGVTRNLIPKQELTDGGNSNDVSGFLNAESVSVEGSNDFSEENDVVNDKRRAEGIFGSDKHVEGLESVSSSNVIGGKKRKTETGGGDLIRKWEKLRGDDHSNDVSGSLDTDNGEKGKIGKNVDKNESNLGGTREDGAFEKQSTRTTNRIENLDVSVGLLESASANIERNVEKGKEKSRINDPSAEKISIAPVDVSNFKETATPSFATHQSQSIGVDNEKTDVYDVNENETAEVEKERSVQPFDGSSTTKHNELFSGKEGNLKNKSPDEAAAWVSKARQISGRIDIVKADTNGNNDNFEAERELKATANEDDEGTVHNVSQNGEVDKKANTSSNEAENERSTALSGRSTSDEYDRSKTPQSNEKFASGQITVKKTTDIMQKKGKNSNDNSSKIQESKIVSTEYDNGPGDIENSKKMTASMKKGYEYVPGIEEDKIMMHGTNSDEEFHYPISQNTLLGGNINDSEEIEEKSTSVSDTGASRVEDKIFDANIQSETNESVKSGRWIDDANSAPAEKKENTAERDFNTIPAARNSQSTLSDSEETRNRENVKKPPLDLNESNEFESLSAADARMDAVKTANDEYGEAVPPVRDKEGGKEEALYDLIGKEAPETSSAVNNRPNKNNGMVDGQNDLVRSIAAENLNMRKQMTTDKQTGLQEDEKVSIVNSRVESSKLTSEIQQENTSGMENLGAHDLVAKETSRNLSAMKNKLDIKNDASEKYSVSGSRDEEKDTKGEEKGEALPYDFIKKKEPDKHHPARIYSGYNSYTTQKNDKSTTKVTGAFEFTGDENKNLKSHAKQVSEENKVLVDADNKSDANNVVKDEATAAHLSKDEKSVEKITPELKVGEEPENSSIVNLQSDLIKDDKENKILADAESERNENNVIEDEVTAAHLNENEESAKLSTGNAEIDINDSANEDDTESTSVIKGMDPPITEHQETRVHGLIKNEAFGALSAAAIPEHIAYDANSKSGDLSTAIGEANNFKWKKEGKLQHELVESEVSDVSTDDDNIITDLDQIEGNNQSNIVNDDKNGAAAEENEKMADGLGQNGKRHILSNEDSVKNINYDVKDEYSKLAEEDEERGKNEVENEEKADQNSNGNEAERSAARGEKYSEKMATSIQKNINTVEKKKAEEHDSGREEKQKNSSNENGEMNDSNGISDKNNEITSSTEETDKKTIGNAANVGETNPLNHLFAKNNQTNTQNIKNDEFGESVSKDRDTDIEEDDTEARESIESKHSDDSPLEDNLRGSQIATNEFDKSIPSIRETDSKTITDTERNPIKKKDPSESSSTANNQMNVDRIKNNEFNKSVFSTEESDSKKDTITKENSIESDISDVLPAGNHPIDSRDILNNELNETGPTKGMKDSIKEELSEHNLIENKVSENLSTAGNKIENENGAIDKYGESIPAAREADADKVKNMEIAAEDLINSQIYTASSMKSVQLDGKYSESVTARSETGANNVKEDKISINESIEGHVENKASVANVQENIGSQIKGFVEPSLLTEKKSDANESEENQETLTDDSVEDQRSEELLNTDSQVEDITGEVIDHYPLTRDADKAESSQIESSEEMRYGLNENLSPMKPPTAASKEDIDTKKIEKYIKSDTETFSNTIDQQIINSSEEKETLPSHKNARNKLEENGAAEDNSNISRTAENLQTATEKKHINFYDSKDNIAVSNAAINSNKLTKKDEKIPHEAPERNRSIESAVENSDTIPNVDKSKNQNVLSTSDSEANAAKVEELSATDSSSDNEKEVLRFITARTPTENNVLGENDGEATKKNNTKDGFISECPECVQTEEESNEAEESKENGDGSEELQARDVQTFADSENSEVNDELYKDKDVYEKKFKGGELENYSAEEKEVAGENIEGSRNFEKNSVPLDTSDGKHSKTIREDVSESDDLEGNEVFNSASRGNKELNNPESEVKNEEAKTMHDSEKNYAFRESSIAKPYTTMTEVNEDYVKTLPVTKSESEFNQKFHSGVPTIADSENGNSSIKVPKQIESPEKYPENLRERQTLLSDMTPENLSEGFTSNNEMSHSSNDSTKTNELLSEEKGLLDKENDQKETIERPSTSNDEDEASINDLTANLHSEKRNTPSNTHNLHPIMHNNKMRPEDSTEEYKTPSTSARKQINGDKPTENKSSVVDNEVTSETKEGIKPLHNLITDHDPEVLSAASTRAEINTAFEEHIESSIETSEEYQTTIAADESLARDSNTNFAGVSKAINNEENSENVSEETEGSSENYNEVYGSEESETMRDKLNGKEGSAKGFDHGMRNDIDKKNSRGFNDLDNGVYNGGIKNEENSEVDENIEQDSGSLGDLKGEIVRGVNDDEDNGGQALESDKVDRLGLINDEREKYGLNEEGKSSEPIDKNFEVTGNRNAVKNVDESSKIDKESQVTEEKGSTVIEKNFNEDEVSQESSIASPQSVATPDFDGQSASSVAIDPVHAEVSRDDNESSSNLPEDQLQEALIKYNDHTVSNSGQPDLQNNILDKNDDLHQDKSRINSAIDERYDSDLNEDEKLKKYKDYNNEVSNSNVLKPTSLSEDAARGNVMHNFSTGNFKHKMDEVNDAEKEKALVHSEEDSNKNEEFNNVHDLNSVISNSKTTQPDSTNGSTPHTASITDTKNKNVEANDTEEENSLIYTNPMETEKEDLTKNEKFINHRGYNSKPSNSKTMKPNSLNQNDAMDSTSQNFNINDRGGTDEHLNQSVESIERMTKQRNPNVHHLDEKHVSASSSNPNREIMGSSDVYADGEVSFAEANPERAMRTKGETSLEGLNAHDSKETEIESVKNRYQVHGINGAYGKQASFIYGQVEASHSSAEDAKTINQGYVEQLKKKEKESETNRSDMDLIMDQKPQEKDFAREASIAIESDDDMNTDSNFREKEETERSMEYDLSKNSSPKIKSVDVSDTQEISGTHADDRNHKGFVENKLSTPKAQTIASSLKHHDSSVKNNIHPHNPNPENDTNFYSTNNEQDNIENNIVNPTDSSNEDNTERLLNPKEATSTENARINSRNEASSSLQNNISKEQSPESLITKTNSLESQEHMKLNSSNENHAFDASPAHDPKSISIVTAVEPDHSSLMIDVQSDDVDEDTTPKRTSNTEYKHEVMSTEERERNLSLATSSPAESAEVISADKSDVAYGDSDKDRDLSTKLITEIDDDEEGGDQINTRMKDDPVSGKPEDGTVNDTRRFDSELGRIDETLGDEDIKNKRKEFQLMLSVRHYKSNKPDRQAGGANYNSDSVTKGSLEKDYEAKDGFGISLDQSDALFDKTVHLSVKEIDDKVGNKILLRVEQTESSNENSEEVVNSHIVKEHNVFSEIGDSSVPEASKSRRKSFVNSKIEEISEPVFKSDNISESYERKSQEISMHRPESNEGTRLKGPKQVYSSDASESQPILELDGSKYSEFSKEDTSEDPHFEHKNIKDSTTNNEASKKFNYAAVEKAFDLKEQNVHADKLYAQKNIDRVDKLFNDIKNELHRALSDQSIPGKILKMKNGDGVLPEIDLKAVEVKLNENGKLSDSEENNSLERKRCKDGKCNENYYADLHNNQFKLWKPWNTANKLKNRSNHRNKFKNFLNPRRKMSEWHVNVESNQYGADIEKYLKSDDFYHKSFRDYQKKNILSETSSTVSPESGIADEDKISKGKESTSVNKHSTAKQGESSTDSNEGHLRKLKGDKSARNANVEHATEESREVNARKIEDMTEENVESPVAVNKIQIAKLQVVQHENETRESKEDGSSEVSTVGTTYKKSIFPIDSQHPQISKEEVKTVARKLQRNEDAGATEIAVEMVSSRTYTAQDEKETNMLHGKDKNEISKTITLAKVEGESEKLDGNDHGSLKGSVATSKDNADYDRWLLWREYYSKIKKIDSSLIQKMKPYFVGIQEFENGDRYLRKYKALYEKSASSDEDSINTDLKECDYSAKEAVDESSDKHFFSSSTADDKSHKFDSKNVKSWPWLSTEPTAPSLQAKGAGSYWNFFHPEDDDFRYSSDDSRSNEKLRGSSPYFEKVRSPAAEEDSNNEFESKEHVGSSKFARSNDGLSCGGELGVPVSMSSIETQSSDGEDSRRIAAAESAGIAELRKSEVINDVLQTTSGSVTSRQVPHADVKSTEVGDIYGDVSSDVKDTEDVNRRTGVAVKSADTSAEEAKCRFKVPEKEKVDVYIVRRNSRGPVRVTHLRGTTPRIVSYGLIPKKVYERTLSIFAKNQIFAKPYPIRSISRR